MITDVYVCNCIAKQKIINGNGRFSIQNMNLKTPPMYVPGLEIKSCNPQLNQNNNNNNNNDYNSYNNIIFVDELSIQSLIYFVIPSL